MLHRPAASDARRDRRRRLTNGRRHLPDRAGRGAALHHTRSRGAPQRQGASHPSKLNEEQRQALARIVDSGPIPAIHGGVRRKDLARWLFEEVRIEGDQTTVGRALRALGLAKLSARPRP